MGNNTADSLATSTVGQLSILAGEQSRNIDLAMDAYAIYSGIGLASVFDLPILNQTQGMQVRDIHSLFNPYPLYWQIGKQ